MTQHGKKSSKEDSDSEETKPQNEKEISSARLMRRTLMSEEFSMPHSRRSTTDTKSSSSKTERTSSDSSKEQS